MKPQKNKYIVFAAIGFELVSLILAAIWAGNFLQKKGYDSAPAFAIVLAFFVWFISLIIKLKSIQK